MRHYFRSLVRGRDLYDEYLMPKLQWIMESDLSDRMKIDRVYWMRRNFPVEAPAKLPVVLDDGEMGFQWEWESEE